MSHYHRWPLSKWRGAALLLVLLLLTRLDVQIGAQPRLLQPAPSATKSTSSPTLELTATTSPTLELTATTAMPTPTCAVPATTNTPSPTPELTATISPTLELTTTATVPAVICAVAATTNTPSPTSNPLTPSTSATARSTISTPTPTLTATPTSSPSATPTVVSTTVPTAVPATVVTSLPTTAVAPPRTPTTVPTPADGVLCVPGTSTLLTGEGPPHVAFLLVFDQRIVGGGSTDADGLFQVPLALGSERAGYYRVTVQIRGTNQILGQWTCIVPEVTPTRTPPRLAP
jgi:hypothetical protein